MTTSQRLTSLAVGGVFGLAGTAVWLCAVVLNPPIPSNALGATVTVMVAMAAAARVRRRAPWVAGLSAGLVGCWSVVVAVAVLMPVVPPRWVPSIVTLALTPADNLAQSRIETVDPYMALLFFGLLMAGGLVVALSPRLGRRIGHRLMPPVVASPTPQVR